QKGLPQLFLGDQTLAEEDLTELVLGKGNARRTQLIEIEGLKCVSVPSRSRFCGRNPRKRHERLDGIEQFRTDTRHAVEPAEAAKWTVFGAPRDDSLRERRSDPGQACDLAHVGPIDVNALAGKQRARQLGGASRRLAQATRRNDGGRLKSNVTGWIAWRGRQYKSNSGACQGQACQQERGAFVIHSRASYVVRRASVLLVGSS
ncbi:MAG TPA: hypothetical protein VF919_03985, partial [Gemmatimonadales bacterium]